MEYISLLESSKIASSNKYRTILIKTIVDVDGEDEQFTLGHCHVEKSNTNIPDYIYEEDIAMYEDDIVAITKYSIH